ncbi:LPS heptosyltransferase III [Dissulfurispira thermophila]|uniref:LPS heptosyltransferase III n=1 Tax=Dissulfurispira thermophila TaxID=2715679 RepID=A0A7G1H594_9BACT|nr:putative lipopolysaccharide heptosyltransferase III [Dissulfurispira thermophila]BCB97291.1 LPS heptosyltransferase III [Dissulfurispira thermophila]
MSHTFKDIHRILVIKLRHIGDVLLTAPVFRALKEKFPDAQITALVNSGTEDVLKGNTLIDEILIMDRSIKRLSIIQRYAKEIFFLKDIRANGFDMTIDLTGGDRAAVISFASGARYRLGWKSDKGFIGKKYVYTHLSEPDANKHIVLQNLDVISQFGITTEDLTVNFYIPDDDRIFIKDILRKYNADKETNIVHIHPTSRWLFKCWKDEYMAEVIRWLLDRGNRVIVTSSPDKKEVEKAKKILSLVGNSRSSLLIDLCGKTTIKQLGAISEVSNLFFGVDSAPMHIAAAVGTPVVALFGPSGTFHWGPWDNKISNFKFQISNYWNPYPNRNGIQTFAIHTVIQRDWDCIPCGKDGCNGSKISKCLDDIRPDEVIEIIKNVIIK